MNLKRAAMSARTLQALERILQHVPPSCNMRQRLYVDDEFASIRFTLVLCFKATGLAFTTVSRQGSVPVQSALND